MEGYGSLEKWDDPNFNEEEEETLSLSDLPQSFVEDKQKTKVETETEEEFDFGSMRGSVLIESEMCAADEVFFQGQLLPLRLSVSSENGMPAPKQENSSRSESIERSSSDGFTSLSSRSNSIGSHNSSNTTITTSTATTTTTTSTYKPKFRNQFHNHSYPSPKPKKFSLPKPGNGSNRVRKSNMWGFFKVGLVRTPEIELQELKLRSLNSRSSSSSSSRKSADQPKKKERFLFENCKCSVDSVDTIVITKKSNNKKRSINGRESKDEVKDKEKQRKQDLHHRRTFEWLKELSIADFSREES